MLRFTFSFYVFYSKLLKAARKEKKLKQGLEVTAANQLNCYTKNMHIIYSLLNIFIQNLSHLVNMVLPKDILDYCKTIFFILYTWSQRKIKQKFFFSKGTILRGARALLFNIWTIVRDREELFLFWNSIQESCAYGKRQIQVENFSK